MNEFIQINEVLHDDPVSPLLYNIATSDIAEEIKRESKATLYIYTYTDDIALTSTDKTDLKNAMDTLARWSEKEQLPDH